jgi:hypothetical protein
MCGWERVCDDVDLNPDRIVQKRRKHDVPRLAGCSFSDVRISHHRNSGRRVLNTLERRKVK